MADALLVGLILIVFAALAAILVLLRRLDRRAKEGALDESALSAHVMASLRQSGLSQDMGQVKQMAQEMSQATNDLKRVFQVQQQRGQLGELQLEAILSDMVPPDRLQIRTNFALIGTPDAAIKVRDGLVCIDSKFPLDQYRDLVAAPEGEREARTKIVLRAVRGHLDTIATKYVRPDSGTTPFALAFIPSEAVYTFIHQADPGLGREYALRGVLLASPSTLTTHVALIVKGVQAEVLTQRVDLVQRSLQRLERELDGVREQWDILRKHVKNANDQAQRVETSLQTLDGAYRAAASLGVKAEPEERTIEATIQAATRGTRRLF